MSPESKKEFIEHIQAIHEKTLESVASQDATLKQEVFTRLNEIAAICDILKADDPEIGRAFANKMLLCSLDAIDHVFYEIK